MIKSNDSHRRRDWGEICIAPDTALEDGLITISFSKNRCVSQLDNGIAGTNRQTQ